MKDQPALIRKPAVRWVHGRVKGVELNVASDAAAPLLKSHTFELRKDGLWFHRKHSSKWTKVEFAGLVAEARRQEAAAKAAEQARWEDPRQMRMFEPKKDEQRSLNI